MVGKKAWATTVAKNDRRKLKIVVPVVPRGSRVGRPICVVVSPAIGRRGWRVFVLTVKRNRNCRVVV